MNKAFGIPVSIPAMLDFPYVVFVEGIPFRGFYTMFKAVGCFDRLLADEPCCSVSIVYNPKYGDNKEAADV